jgi:hypothetical protein
MWCNRCQQDIPTVRQTSGDLVCLLCGWVYSREGERPSKSDESAPQSDSPSVREEPLRLATDTPAKHQPHYDGWEIEQELLHIKRLLAEEYLTGHQVSRFEPPHLSVQPSHLDRKSGRRRFVTASSTGDADRHAAWWLFLCGVTTFGCGSILLGWGFSLAQERLLTWGVPILVVGLVFFVAAIFLAIANPVFSKIPEEALVKDPISHVEAGQLKPDLL